MRNYHFSIIVEKDENGYFVFCSELQGCYTQGDTYEEALNNIRDAISLHLEDRIANKEGVSKTESVSLPTIEIAV